MSEKFVLVEEGVEDFLYPRQAASEIRGVTIGADKVMQGLQNIVRWKEASYTNIGYDLSEQHFAGKLKVENVVDDHLLMCTVRVMGSLVDYHYPLCAKMEPHEPTLDVSGHYVMDVTVTDSELPCEVRGTAKPGQMIAATVLVENLTVPGHLVYTAVLGNNTMYVGKICKTFWHVPSYKDAIRTVVKMKRVVAKIMYDWNFNGLKAIFGNKLVMLAIAAVAAMMIGGRFSVLVIGIVGLAMLPYISASEFGCTIDFTRKTANCGRGIFVTNEQWVSGYGISIRDGDKLAECLFSKSNETDVMCVDCYSKLQCNALDAVITMAGLVAAKHGIEQHYENEAQGNIYTWGSREVRDIVYKDVSFSRLDSIKARFTKVFNKFDLKTKIVLLNVGQPWNGCTMRTSVQLEPNRWYRGLTSVLEYVPVTLNTAKPAGTGRARTSAASPAKPARTSAW